MTDFHDGGWWVPTNPKHLAFIKSFENLLREEDATGLFGLCKYSVDDFKGRVEITEGRANINLLPDDLSPNSSMISEFPC